MSVEILWITIYLVSLFNDISVFMGYLMPKLFLEKYNIDTI